MMSVVPHIRCAQIACNNKYSGQQMYLMTSQTGAVFMLAPLGGVDPGGGLTDLFIMWMEGS